MKTLISAIAAVVAISQPVPAPAGGTCQTFGCWCNCWC